MKYKIKGTNDYLIDPIGAILTNRDIVDKQKFLCLGESVVHDWELLNNIHTAVQCVLSHLRNNSNIFIQVDGDADGYSSSALLINYIRRIIPDANVIWRLHKGKEHGIVLDGIPDGVNLVIVPDAGSNQYEEHQKLKEKGIDVIVLDHHQCEQESQYAIVVNNQLSPDYPNKNLSGVGITYKFCKALDDTLGVNYADSFLDLVAVGNIADAMDMRELETRYYVLKGLKQINNPLLKALIEKQDYSIKSVVNITNVSFYIVPLINATIRSGTQEEKENVFKCLIESDEKVYYKRNDEWESIHKNTARQMGNIRVRQNKLRDKGVELIEERIQEKELYKNKVLIVNVTGILDKNLSGLVANRLMDRYKRPVVLLRQHEDNPELFGGSARGYEKSEIKNFRRFLLETEKFNFCEGHDNAFGYEIHKDKIVEVNDYINEILKDIEMGSDTYEVDFAIPANKLNENLINDLYKMRDLWGYKVEEPLLVIKDIPLNCKDIQLNKSVLKFVYKGIEFIKFKSNEDEYNELIKNKGISFTALGRCSANEWNGKITPQFIIDDYEVEERQVLLF